MLEFHVQEGDARQVRSDLLLLKHAQAFYGADQAVAARLVAGGICSLTDIQPPPGEFVALETRGTIAPRRVMFLGTPPLRSFTYNEMEVFAERAVERIADLGLSVDVLTTTVHGTGYGLDGGEALQRLVRGFRAGLARVGFPAVRKVIFLTLGKRAERMLKNALAAVAVMQESAGPEPTLADQRVSATITGGPPVSTPTPAAESAARAAARPEPIAVRKRRIFVAMPFSEESQNVYEYGTYPAVRSCEFICERVDETHFTGDVLGRIRNGIEAADLVIADLTEGRPNVYLEVGYAWGRGIPVIFVARKGEKLHFDVSTHRCIFYGKFSQFARDLEDLIRGIYAAQGSDNRETKTGQ
jgi:hypothetical protein